MRFCLKKKIQIKPTYTVHDRNRNKTNFKHKQIIIITIIIIIIIIGTFQQLLDTYVGSFLVIDRQTCVLSLLSNGSWTRHCIFWNVNLVLHYNICQFRLINKTQQRTVSFSNLCFCLKKKKKCMNSNLFFH